MVQPSLPLPLPLPTPTWLTGDPATQMCVWVKCLLCIALEGKGGGDSQLGSCQNSLLSPSGHPNVCGTLRQCLVLPFPSLPSSLPPHISVTLCGLVLVF